jgi:hypothetical protein
MPFFIDTKSIFPGATAEPGNILVIFLDNPVSCVNLLLVKVVFRGGIGGIWGGVHTASGSTCDQNRQEKRWR